MKNNINIKPSVIELPRLFERYKQLNQQLILCKYEENEHLSLDILVERRKIMKEMDMHHNNIKKQLGVK